MNYACRENLADVTVRNMKPLVTGHVLGGCSSFEWQTVAEGELSVKF